MSVRVTFAEVLVPAHDYRGVPPQIVPPAEPETEVPDDVSALNIIGAHFDPVIKMWRVLAWRYRDVPDVPPERPT